MSDFYKTIKERSQAKYTEKMSKFLAFAVPVSTAEEAESRGENHIQRISRRKALLLGVYDWHRAQ